VKDILDTIILIMFVIMVAMFIINFNRQQIKKHTDKLDENENNNNSKKETINE
jgi:preprotein translocase subunit YajC